MKKILLPAFLAFTIFVASCNSKDEKTADNKEVITDPNANQHNNNMMQDTTMSGNNSAANNNAGNDNDFAMSAADGGMTEEKLGKLGRAQGSSAKVKDLGKMMEMDHGMANKELKAWAAKNNVQLPAEISAEKQQKYDELAAKKGADFDKAYADFMVSEHEKVIAMFTKESTDGKNSELKTWAAGKIPTLQHHLEMSKATADAVKK